jgi:pimeloyl-ACP methyl ester carboxylesterase
MAQRPCIVIPGIEGSGLENFYPVSPQTTWSLSTILEGAIIPNDFASLALDDNGDSDLTDDVVTRPSQALRVVYESLVSGLRGRLGAPVYLFPYDWRLSIERTAASLVDFVKRISGRPMKTVTGWDKKFDVVCHSLGGLVLRQFVAEWPRQNPGVPLPIGSVVFIATPQSGSLLSVQEMTMGQSSLLGDSKASRKLARTFPSVYELLPTFPDAVTRNGAALDIFKEGNWQANITSLPGNDPNGYAVEQHHLDDARALLDALPDPSSPTFGIARDDMLVVYGSKPASTMQTVPVGPGTDRWYSFDQATLADGDGSVTVDSALPPNFNLDSVMIRFADLSWLDQARARVAFHALLPTLDEVQTVVGKFLQGERSDQLLPRNIRSFADILMHLR